LMKALEYFGIEPVCKNWHRIEAPHFVLFLLKNIPTLQHLLIWFFYANKL
jgi:hypothetical protein